VETHAETHAKTRGNPSHPTRTSNSLDDSLAPHLGRGPTAATSPNKKSRNKRRQLTHNRQPSAGRTRNHNLNLHTLLLHSLATIRNVFSGTQKSLSGSSKRPELKPASLYSPRALQKPRLAPLTHHPQRWSFSAHTMLTTTHQRPSPAKTSNDSRGAKTGRAVQAFSLL
jgi:hypothetical protein